MADEEQENPFAGVAGQVDYGKFSFKVSRHILVSLCESAVMAVPPKDGQRPDLTCFQLKLAPGGLRVAATDSERTVVTATEAVSYDGTGDQAYIPAKRLLAILKESPEGDVSVTVAGNTATVTTASGYSAELRMPPAAAYPQIPSPSSLSFSAYPREKLLAALKAVRHAVCRDGSLANMTQVSIGADSAGQVSVTATDANRMARAVLPDFPQAFCIPYFALDDVVRLLSGSPAGEIGVGQTDKLAAFQAGHVVLAYVKRNIPFPDVDTQLLKKAAGNDQVIGVDKEALTAAVRRVRINASADNSAIALQLVKGELVVFGRDGDNSAAETVKVSWDGADRLVTTSHVWLSDALSAHPGQSCELKLGKDAGKRRSVIYLAGSGVIQVLSQLPPALVGY